MNTNEAAAKQYWELLQRTIPSSADDAVASARGDRTKRSERDLAVRDEIASTWIEGWDYLDVVLFSMEQNALIMMERANKIDDDHSPAREALLILWSAATLTTHEIRALLLAGLWPGAAARWRALHEVAVAGTLIAKSPDELATRYIDHSFVVQTKRLRDFHVAHNRGPLSKRELDERWERAQQLMSAYRDRSDPVAFDAQYAWALPLIPPGKSARRPRPTFDRLEHLANMSDLRMLVASSHGLVHNDAGGIAASIIERDGYVLSPVARHIPTVGRPTLMSISRMAAAIHLGFEADLNEFSKVIGLLGGALMENARRGIVAFEAQSSGRGR